MKKTLLYSLLLVLFVFINNGCKKNNNINITPGSKFITTVDRTLVQDAIPSTHDTITDPEHFAKNGYGTWHYGPGVPIQRRTDLMPSGYDPLPVTNGINLLRFFTITDIHLTDKESPVQGMYFAREVGQGGIGMLAPLMCYTTQVFNAAVNTINDIHNVDPFDLGLAIGDEGNSSGQYIELRWFIDIMDGQLITPSSGTQPAGVNVPYQQPFQAVGLNKAIPWYAAVGNHDHFWEGSKRVTDKIRHALLGDSIIRVGDIINDPNAMNENTISVGTYDCSGPYPKVIGCGLVADLGPIPTVSPDPNRRALSLTDWVNEFSHTTSSPVGHGFIESDPANVFGACYSFIPKANLPLKIIVLDDTQNPDEAPYQEGVYGHGELDGGRYEWLIAQLRAGQNANQLMIISAHVPIGVVSSVNPFAWEPTPSYQSEASLIDTLKSYSNLILWVAGHRHLNNITALSSNTPGHPENGFWEVETKSIREFPEQFRTFDIVRNSDNSISIIAIDVDANIPEGSQAAIGRSYAIASNQIYGLVGQPLETGSVSYNAELMKQLSPAMKETIKNYVPVK
ncbi:MAG: TIGR03768 family metallophosphoesterase [Bacteroidetes bacterium]|nr:TIGR03768 family metallophosphoesterase [Bacteroidota bacterium]